MISTPTILVLGAGASLNYGFPSGSSLTQQIRVRLASEPEALIRLQQLGFEETHILDFKEAFSKSGVTSIDSFLEFRGDLLNLGKALIAQALVPYEVEDRLFPFGEHLYQYILSKLSSVPEKFAENRIAVLTYNYDRSFEQFLFTALRNRYRLSSTDAAELMKSIPIVHLHGSLGNLPWQSDEGSRDYTPDSSKEKLKLAASKIKVIHNDFAGVGNFIERLSSLTETDPELGQFVKAKKLLETHHGQVIFLGFGYDATNLSRLPYKTCTANLMGSCYGLTDLMISQLRSRFLNDRFNGGHPGFDALGFLRERVIL